MTATAHGERKPFLAREVHGRDDIRGGAAPEDRRRRPVDHAIPYSARLIVAGVATADDGSTQPRAERLKRGTEMS
jgi:hypothetical protein